MHTLPGLALATLLVLGFATAVRAETVTLSAVEDASLGEPIGGDAPAGIGPVMFVGAVEGPPGRAGPLAIRRAVIEFDVAGSIPAGARVDRVELTLYCDEAADDTGLDVALHRLTTDWSGGASQGGDERTPPDRRFVPAASAARAVGATGRYTWGPSPELVADVQAWLDSAAPNHGWILRPLETRTAAAKRFATREHDTVEKRPRLLVTYTPPARSDALGADAEQLPLLPLIALAIVSPLMLLGVVVAMYRIANKPRRR